MQRGKDDTDTGSGASTTTGPELRRYPRNTVFKLATVFPVLHEVGFPIVNMSQFGLMGRCALPLSLRQHIHLTFDGHEYLAAEVRWAEGDRYGLQLVEALMDLPGCAPLADAGAGLRPRAPRIPTDMPATLVTTLPMLSGRIRNISRGGALIEVGVPLREAERLLVRMRGWPTLIGRIQWAKEGSVGLEFSRELATGIGFGQTASAGGNPDRETGQSGRSD